MTSHSPSGKEVHCLFKKNNEEEQRHGMNVEFKIWKFLSTGKEVDRVLEAKIKL